jgi:hypothetical protein
MKIDTQFFYSLVGIGQNQMRRLLSLFIPALGAAFVVSMAYAEQVEYSPLEWVLLALIAADIIGGVFIASNASSQKNTFGKDGFGRKGFLLFAALHLHPFVVAWVFYDSYFSYAFFIYLFMLASVATILVIPSYLRRATALIICGCGITLNFIYFTQAVGFEWFAPFYFIKLIVAHHLKDEE